MKKVFLLCALLFLAGFAASCSNKEAIDLKLCFAEEYVALTDDLAQHSGELFVKSEEEFEEPSYVLIVLDEFSKDETKDKINALEDILDELYLCTNSGYSLMSYEYDLHTLRTFQSISEFSRPLSQEQWADVSLACYSIQLRNEGYHENISQTQ